MPQWDGSHHPSVGFMAYLLTGHWYFMEEVQFATTLNYLNITDLYRTGGYIPEYRIQVRNTAWNVRTLAQALTATPDSDTELRADFIAAMENTVTHFYDRYIAQINNPFGIIWPDVDYGVAGVFMASPWMQDFATAAFGYALALNMPISSTVSAKLVAFFAWKAKSIVGRLGTSASPDYWYINAAPYELAVAPTDTPDFAGGTGPWYPNWRAIYDATSASGAVVAFGTTEGQLSAEIMPGADSMWGNLQPAIAYAVRHGVPGAAAAYQRMTSASNWNQLASQFNSVPVWGVKPLGP